MIIWNLTKNRNKFRKDDILVLSIKSGRTWFRVLLNKYLSMHYGVPFDACNPTKYHEAIPSIGFTHEMWKHYSTAGLSQRIRGKYLIPNKIAFARKVILLCRDPRDTVVSLFFQKTKRSGARVESDISTFIRDPKMGIRNIIHVMNRWHERFRKHPHCLRVSYEELRGDTLGTLIKVLEFIGISDIDVARAKEAIEFAGFENMKAMESRGDFKKRNLQPGDPSDADSFKVREGKVGGYKRHFSEADLNYIDAAMHELDAFYAYAPEVK